MRLVAEGMLAGVPDLFLAQPSGPYAGLFIEMKRPGGGVLSPKQKKIIAALETRGYCVVVANSAEDAVREIKNYLELEK